MAEGGKRPPPAVSKGDREALAESAAVLEALRESGRRGLLKGRPRAKDRDDFARAFAPALAIIEGRFGRVMEKGRRLRTQPADERFMRSAAALLFDLEQAGLSRGLVQEAAALAVLTFYVGDYKDALHWVNHAAKEDPDEAMNKLNGAVLAAEFFDFELSLRLVGEVLRDAPDLPSAWALKARALIGQKLAEEAAATGLEKKGESARARTLRKAAGSRVKDAASALREVVRLEPGNPRAWYEFAKFLFTHGHLKEAADAYGRAVALEPSLKLAWYQKGVCHQMLEQVDLAIDAFERGLALDRRDAGGVYFRLAAMHALQGETDKAFEEIRAGLAINKPNFYSEIYRVEFAPLLGDPRFQALLTEFFADTGFQHTKAAQSEVGFSWGLFEHGTVLFYDSLADAFGAAEAYRREGDSAKAREFYRKLIELLDRDRHPLKAAAVRRRLATLEGPVVAEPS